ncbi:MAG: hypothetical protein AMXMBFR37_23420 [Steroidobacteraceae bacterium]
MNYRRHTDKEEPMCARLLGIRIIALLVAALVTAFGFAPYEFVHHASISML